ncbi:hypothetical protein U1Q18_000547 [Sarracenia purpurea var. burkii]
MYKEQFPNRKHLHPYERSLIELSLGDGDYEQICIWCLQQKSIQPYAFVRIYRLPLLDLSNGSYVPTAQTLRRRGFQTAGAEPKREKTEALPRRNRVLFDALQNFHCPGRNDAQRCVEEETSGDGGPTMRHERRWFVWAAVRYDC